MNQRTRTMSALPSFESGFASFAGVETTAHIADDSAFAATVAATTKVAAPSAPSAPAVAAIISTSHLDRPRAPTSLHAQVAPTCTTTPLDAGASRPLGAAENSTTTVPPAPITRSARALGISPGAYSSSSAERSARPTMAPLPIDLLPGEAPAFGFGARRSFDWLPINEELVLPVDDNPYVRAPALKRSATPSLSLNYPTLKRHRPLGKQPSSIDRLSLHLPSGQASRASLDRIQSATPSLAPSLPPPEPCAKPSLSRFTPPQPAPSSSPPPPLLHPAPTQPARTQHTLPLHPQVPQQTRSTSSHPPRYPTAAVAFSSSDVRPRPVSTSSPSPSPQPQSQPQVQLHPSPPPAHPALVPPPRTTVSFPSPPSLCVGDPRRVTSKSNPLPVCFGSRTSLSGDGTDNCPRRLSGSSPLPRPTGLCLNLNLVGSVHTKEIVEDSMGRAPDDVLSIPANQRSMHSVLSSGIARRCLASASGSEGGGSASVSASVGGLLSRVRRLSPSELSRMPHSGGANGQDLVDGTDRMYWGVKREPDLDGVQYDGGKEEKVRDCEHEDQERESERERERELERERECKELECERQRQREREREQERQRQRQRDQESQQERKMVKQEHGPQIIGMNRLIERSVERSTTATTAMTTRVGGGSIESDTMDEVQALNVNVKGETVTTGWGRGGLNVFNGNGMVALPQERGVGCDGGTRVQRSRAETMALQGVTELDSAPLDAAVPLDAVPLDVGLHDSGVAIGHNAEAKELLEVEGKMLRDSDGFVQCPNCPRRLRNAVTLQNHIRVVHENNGNFRCTQCPLTFMWRSTLGNHVRLVHEKQRPYECKECGKAFRWNSHLREHFWVVHKGEKPFRCDKCGRLFGRKNNMQKHMRRHGDGEAAT